MSATHSAIHVAIRAVLYSGSAIVLGGLAGQVLAQSAPPPEQGNGKKPQTLQAIEVTGSHIRRAQIETDNPLITLSSQQIQATGQLTLGGIIQNLPAVAGDVLNPNVNNGFTSGLTGGDGSGATLVGLRGLGASRTLILVDGQRVFDKDLNSIPTAAVDHVEVLTSGASAIYGSDAIGGVINFILKQNYQGAQAQLDYGISDHGDGARRGANFMFGQTSDKGSILVGAGYQKMDSISQAQRKFADQVLSLSTTSGGRQVPFVGGTEFAPRDWIELPSSLAQKFGCASGGALSLNASAYASGKSPTGPGDYHCFGNDDRFDYAAPNLMVTPQERTNAFLNGVYHLTSNIDFYATYYHSKVDSMFRLPSNDLGTDLDPNLVIPANNYYNPFDVDFSLSNGALYRSALLAAGPIEGRNSNTTDQLMTGVRGRLQLLDHDWHWDLGYNYGHQSSFRQVLGLQNIPELTTGLGPSFMNADGVVQCGTSVDPIPLAQCVPWDPFNLNSPSAVAALQAATQPALENFWGMERTWHAGANGGLFELPAGTAELAVGLDYRKEYENNVIGPEIAIDPSTLTCILGSQCSAHVQGGFNVKEGYAELFLPLLQDLPLVNGLNVTLADRYSKYSDFGSTNNWKIGTEYRPIEDLLLRGTVARVFRAPTIEDLFSPPTTNFPGIASDPCDGITTPGNPACVGVPTDGSFVDIDDNQQVNGVSMGSKAAGLALGPEFGKSFDFGVVYSPKFVPGFSVSVDAWRIFLNNTIGTVGAQSVLDQCYAGNLTFCPFISRAVGTGLGAGQLIHVITPTANLGRLDVKGTDLDLEYRLPTLPFGQFHVGLHSTYLTQFKIQTAPHALGNEVINGAGLMGWFGSTLQSECPFSLGGMCFFPRVRAQGTLGWQLGPWNAQWTMRYSSRFSMADSTGDVEGIDRYPAYVYNDLTMGYAIAPLNANVQVGVDNVFDKQPPILFDNRTLNANTDPEAFDVVGRYYWARLTVQF